LVPGGLQVAQLGVQQGQAAAPDRHRGGVLDGGKRAGQHLPRPALLDPDLGELDAEGDHGVEFLRVAAMLQRLGGKGRCLLQPSGRLGEHGPHLAGAVGAALTGRLFDLGWIRRAERSRAVHLTDRGRKGFLDVFGFKVDASPCR
jgi:hypothetical protein